MCLFNEVKRSCNDSSVPIRPVGGSKRTPERVVGDQRPRETHVLYDVAEGGDVDADRRNAGLFQCPSNVPDRHVADGSDRYKQHHIDICFLDHLHPPGPRLFAHPALGCSPGERVERVSQLSNPTGFCRRS